MRGRHYGPSSGGGLRKQLKEIDGGGPIAERRDGVDTEHGRQHGL